MNDRPKSVKTCPKCGDSGYVYVYDSRSNFQGEVIRRRICKKCGQKFVTIEKFFGMGECVSEQAEI